MVKSIEYLYKPAMSSLGQGMDAPLKSDISEMSDDEIVAEFAKLIKKCIPEVDDSMPINGDSNLSDDLGIDSLGGYELIMAAEDHFGIEISDSQVESIKTIQDLIFIVRSAYV